MKVVIATAQNRVVRRAANRGIVKYVSVRADKKFHFDPNVNTATVFDSVGKAQQALGARARKLRGEPTSDLVLVEVAGSGITLGQVLNGN